MMVRHSAIPYGVIRPTKRSPIANLEPMTAADPMSVDPPTQAKGASPGQGPKAVETTDQASPAKPAGTTDGNPAAIPATGTTGGGAAEEISEATGIGAITVTATAPAPSNPTTATIHRTAARAMETTPIPSGMEGMTGAEETPGAGVGHRPNANPKLWGHQSRGLAFWKSLAKASVSSASGIAISSKPRTTSSSPRRWCAASA